MTLRAVGDGPLSADARRLAEQLGIADRVEFEGRCDDLDKLRELFSHAALLLSPGYVGLNVVQALGFGTPVVYPLGEPHAPEVEALDDNNSATFPAGDVEACAQVITRSFYAWKDGESADRIAEEARALQHRGDDASVRPPRSGR